MGLTDYIVPLLLAGTAACALARRVDVYAALTAGAKPAGVRSPRRYIALSQLTKAKKQKLGARRTLKSAALLCYLTIKDIFQK